MGTNLDRNIIARFTKQCLKKLPLLLQCHDRSGIVLFRGTFFPCGLELKLIELNGRNQILNKGPHEVPQNLRHSKLSSFRFLFSL